MINYLIFIFLMMLVRENGVVWLQISNLISWVTSMLFIFFIDKLFVPDLVNEHNSKELFQFVFEQIKSADRKKMSLFRRWVNV
jgi:putative flippase GtrA